MEPIIYIILYITIANTIILLITILKLNQIQMTQEELKTALDAANTKVDKIKTEIQALKDALGNAGNVSPELQAAAEQLFTNLQSADDLNEDAPGE